MLGYKIVEAERRGQKIKKKFDIDPVEAETVRLIYKLYLDGDGTTGPLGVKEAVEQPWLPHEARRHLRGWTGPQDPDQYLLRDRAMAVRHAQLL